MHLGVVPRVNKFVEVNGVFARRSKIVCSLFIFKINIDDIEMDNLDKPEEEPEGQQEQETNIDDDDWRDQSIVIIDTSNPDSEIPNLKKDAGVIRRTYTEDKKSLLREMGININKGDGPSAKAVFDGTRIIVQKGKRLVYTEDVKKASKVNEFKKLVERAELEHGKTGVAVVEKAVPDVTVNEHLANSVLRNSIERLESEIDEMVANIESRSVETSVTLDKEKIREFRGITKTADHNLDNGGLKVQEEYFRNLARDEPNELRSKLYEEIADVCALKADEIRLRRNQRPESELARSIVEEEAQNNDLTRFERFKRWTKKNLGVISAVAISVAGIIITIVMGARNAVKRGARATSKFAKTLSKIAEKAAPVLGALLNLAAKVLTLGAKAVGFLSEHLWILAVAIAYALYERRRR